MRRWSGWIAIGLMLVVCAVALAAYGGTSRAQTLDARTQAVAAGLRCPICQGESVADSPSDISRAMRAEIRRRLADGQTPAQIRAYFVSKYGDWILLAPPPSGAGRFAWLAPPLLLLAGAGLLVMLLVDWRARGREGPSARRERYLARIRAELAMDLPDEA